MLERLRLLYYFAGRGRGGRDFGERGGGRGGRGGGGGGRYGDRERDHEEEEEREHGRENQRPRRSEGDRDGERHDRGDSPRKPRDSGRNDRKEAKGWPTLEEAQRKPGPGKRDAEQRFVQHWIPPRSPIIAQCS